MFRRSLLAMPLAGAARAQWAPSRPIRLIIAFPPGGSTDVLGRLIAPLLAARLGQPVVPENRSGAAGAVGSGFVASAPADGHTILLDSGGQAVNPYLMRGLGFDYVTGFAPITLLATLPLVLVVLAESGITTLAELLARARAEPAAYGSVGVGSRTHLAGALLLRRAGIAGTHVPYRGGAPMATALLAGDIQMSFSTVPSVIQHIKSGKLRAIAVTGDKSIETLSDIKPIKDQGVPGYKVGSWYGILAPSGTPPAIINKINNELGKIVANPEVRAKLLEQGWTTTHTTPAQMNKQIQTEIQDWKVVIEKAGITLD